MLGELLQDRVGGLDPLLDAFPLVEVEELLKQRALLRGELTLLQTELGQFVGHDEDERRSQNLNLRARSAALGPRSKISRSRYMFNFSCLSSINYI